jgi:threonine/homoserine/homoserine lactone efflux protein
VHQSYWSFLVLCALLTVTPGADTALVLKSSLSAPGRSFIATIAGISVGLLFHAMMSALGLSAILMASSNLYSVVQFLGAGYLIYLGVRGLYEAWFKSSDSFASAAATAPTRSAQRRSLAEFRTGLMTNLLNPKVAVFYLTFLPQFIDPTRNVFLQSLLLALTHIVLSFAWLTMIGFFVGYFRSQLEKKTVRRVLESLTGVALLGFGIKLATSKI